MAIDDTLNSALKAYSMPTMWETARKATMSPLGLAALTGVAAWGGSKLLYPYVSGALGQFARTFKNRTNASFSEQDIQELESEMANKQSPYAKWIPIGIGALAAAGTAIPFMDFRDKPYGAPYYGMFSWKSKPAPAASYPNRVGVASSSPFGTPATGAGMPKSSSLLFDSNVSDQTVLDVQKLVPVNAARNLVLQDPIMPVTVKGSMLDIIDDTYAREKRNQVSLGGLFDSARDAVQDALTLKGVTSAAVRGVVGYAGGKVIANALGTMIDLPKEKRELIQSVGLFANPISALFL